MSRGPAVDASLQGALGSAVQQRDLQQAGRLARAAAGDHVRLSLNVEQEEEPCERGGIEAAQGVRHRLANRAENRRPDVNAHRLPTESSDRAAAMIAAADDALRH